MRPGENQSLLRLTTRAEYRAVYEGLKDPRDVHMDTRRALFYSFNETDYEQPFNAWAGTYEYKPRLDNGAGYDVSVDNLDLITQACEATLAVGGIRGCWLRVINAKAAANEIITALSSIVQSEVQ